MAKQEEGPVLAHNDSSAQVCEVPQPELHNNLYKIWLMHMQEI
jgi:hypothetical protein